MFGGRERKGVKEIIREHVQRETQRVLGPAEGMRLIAGDRYAYSLAIFFQLRASSDARHERSIGTETEK